MIVPGASEETQKNMGKIDSHWTITKDKKVQIMSTIFWMCAESHLIYIIFLISMFNYKMYSVASKMHQLW